MGDDDEEQSVFLILSSHSRACSTLMLSRRAITWASCRPHKHLPGPKCFSFCALLEAPMCIQCFRTNAAVPINHLGKHACAICSVIGRYAAWRLNAIQKVSQSIQARNNSLSPSSKHLVWNCPGWWTRLLKTGLSALKPDGWPTSVGWQQLLLLPTNLLNTIYFYSNSQHKIREDYKSNTCGFHLSHLG